MRTTLYLLVACLFSACSTIEYIGIETYNPAEITFPKKVDKVLIVNNAVPQPDDVGYTYNLYGTVQDTALRPADSALYDACHSLGKSIVDVLSSMMSFSIMMVPVRIQNIWWMKS